MKKKVGKRLKVVVITGYSCSNNCVFCIDADKRLLREKTTAELVSEIYQARKKGAEVLELIGGEATIRPDFARVVSLAKKIGVPDVVCATNGRVFADPDRAREIVGAGIDALIFSVHGASPAVHDALTRSPGSFRQLERGLANLKKLGFKNVNGNTTVVKGNMGRLGEIAKFYLRHQVRNVEYIFVDPNYGGAKNDFRGIVPRISEAAPFMRRALAAGLRGGMDQWKARYVPLCHFKGYEKQISETNERSLFRAEHWAPDFRNGDAIGSRAEVGRKKPARCRGCRLYADCEGIWVEYLKHYGDAELRPVK
ncbi:MAG TPA: radical SAM protein [Elusimicrobiales bacterium]|nr:radical SAM protein [Elusimicrobiales bacterium]